MQRPSSQQRREDSSQFQKQLEAEAAIHKLVGSDGSIQQQQHQQQKVSELETPSRPVSPLITPSVKGRPSSVVLDNITSSNQTTNNPIITDNPNAHSIGIDKDSDTPPQSPITFLDSRGPLIQTQDPEPNLVEKTTQAQNNNTTQTNPPASIYWPSVPSSIASQSIASGANHNTARSDIHTSSLPASSSAFNQQRGQFQPPSILSTITSNTDRSENTINTGLTPSSVNTERYTSTGYLAGPYQPRSGKTPTSPSSQKEEKKKKSWFGLGWGSKGASTAANTKDSSQYPQQHQKHSNPSKSQNQQPFPLSQQQLSQQPIQSYPSVNKGANSRRAQPALQPPSSQQQQAPGKLKKRPRPAEKKQQVYQNPRANNNSPEPSIISKLTNEELDLEDNSSELTENTTDNILAVKSRQQFSNLSDTLADSPRPSLEHLDPGSELSLKTASSQSQQTEIAEPNTVPSAWETGLRQGQGYHQRSASNDETFTLQSAGASAQTQRAELKYRDERYGASSRPPSRQSIEPPSPAGPTSSNIAHQPSNSTQSTTLPKVYMGGSSGQQHPSGRNGELQNNSGNREGKIVKSLSNILLKSNTGQYGSTLSVNNPQQSGSYRNTPQASPMVQDISGGGRSTTPPAVGANKSREDLGAMDVQQLATKHDELSM